MAARPPNKSTAIMSSLSTQKAVQPSQLTNDEIALELVKSYLSSCTFTGNIINPDEVNKLHALNMNVIDESFFIVQLFNAVTKGLNDSSNLK